MRGRPGRLLVGLPARVGEQMDEGGHGPRMKIFDPTAKPVERQVDIAARPASLQGLRLGLVDNTKHNSDQLLLRIADAA